VIEGTITHHDGRLTYRYERYPAPGRRGMDSNHRWHRLLDKLAETLTGQSTAWSAEDQKALQERYAAML
jgi:hypothetical protein